MRYQGQNYEQEVIVPPGVIDDAALTAIYADYGRLYEEFYGYRLDGIPIELVRLSVVATEEPPAFASLPSESGSGDEARTRQVYFPGHGHAATRVVRRESLAPGEQADGPMIVESMDSTVVVPPEWSLRASENGILDVTRR
jgi:N-methylhydantoinase A